jgi:Ca2+-binding RTX toxin-like protein
MDSTDRGAAFVVYPAPRRCEVWLGSTKLGQTTMAAPTSAADGDSKCQTYATTTYQRNGRLFAAIERHSDHYRALMISSSSKACSFTDSILLFTPGVGFRRPAEILNYEVLLGKVAYDPPNPWFDGTLMVTYGPEGGQRIAYLYDRTTGFIKDGLSKNVSFCANDDSTIWDIARAADGSYPFYAWTPQGQPLVGVLQPLVYGSYTLSIDGMGGNDRFYGGDGKDVFTDLTGNNIAYGFGGNDTLRLCNYDTLDCGAGSGDRAYTCRSDTTGTITGCESRSTF